MEGSPQSRKWCKNRYLQNGAQIPSVCNPDDSRKYFVRQTDRVNPGSLLFFCHQSQMKKYGYRTLCRYSRRMTMRTLRQKYSTHKISMKRDCDTDHKYRHIMMNSLSSHQVSDADFIIIFEVCVYLCKNFEIC